MPEQHITAAVHHRTHSLPYCAWWGDHLQNRSCLNVSQMGGKSSPWLQTRNTSTRWKGTFQYRIYSLWLSRLTEDSGHLRSLGLCDFCMYCVYISTDYIAFTALGKKKKIIICFSKCSKCNIISNSVYTIHAKFFMRAPLFWNVTQCRLVVSYKCFFKC